MDHKKITDGLRGWSNALTWDIGLQLSTYVKLINTCSKGADSFEKRGPQEGADVIAISDFRLIGRSGWRE
jgi:hypothetical protein